MTIQNYYYYDDYQCIYHFQGETLQLSPRSYIDQNGILVTLFINHNPWTIVGSERLVYQYCLFCRVKRFELEDTFNEQKSSVCCLSERCVNIWDRFVDEHDSDTLRSILLHRKATTCVLI